MTRLHDASREEAPSAGRRRFVRVLGLGGLFAGFAGALASLAPRDAGAQAATPPPGAPPAPPPAAPAAPPAPSDEAKALHAILVSRYGAHLDDAQKEALLPALEGTVQSGKALRAVKLANSVEPDVIFRAEPPQHDGAGEARR
jgi:hypothetical protein